MDIEKVTVEFMDGPLDGRIINESVFQIMLQGGYVFGWCGVVDGEQHLYVEEHPRTPGPPTRNVKLPPKIQLWHNDGWATCLL